MDSTGWQKKAEQAATWIGEHLLEAHRGAMTWEPGVIALFGNDGYAHDDRTKCEVEAVRRGLPSVPAEELAFATDPSDSYTWVLLVEDLVPAHQTGPGRVIRWELFSRSLDELIWSAWGEACGVRSDPSTPDSFQIQKTIARDAIASHQPLGAT
jgi:hypothetical protein